MGSLEWQDSWSVGNADLDNDHKRLIAIIQTIGQYRTRATDLGRLTHHLEDYTKVHFAREEAMMEAAGVPGLAAHKKQHQAFVEWLSAVRKSFSATHEARGLLIDDVDDYLRRWLTDHILKTDMGYKGLL